MTTLTLEQLTVRLLALETFATKMGYPRQEPEPTVVYGQSDMGLFFNAADIVDPGSFEERKVLWKAVAPSGQVVYDGEGFNIGFLASEVGDYSVTVSCEGRSRSWIGRVAKKDWKIVTDPADLVAAIKAGDANTKIVLTKPTTVSGDNKIKGRLEANGNRITYTGSNYTTDATGKKTWPRLALQLDVGATMDGVDFAATDYTSDMNNRGRNVGFTWAAGNNVISNCKVDKVTQFMNMNNNPVNVAVIGNHITRFMSMYFVWFQGQGIFICGNTAEDSQSEHIVRGSSNYKWVTIVNNEFRNQDLRSQGETANYSKSCINCQWGQYAYVWNNKVHEGAISVGPLGGGDGDKTGSQWVYHAVVRQNQCDGPVGSNMMGLEVQHGIKGLLIEENTSPRLALSNVDLKNGYPATHNIFNAKIEVPAGAQVNGGDGLDKSVTLVRK